MLLRAHCTGCRSQIVGHVLAGKRLPLPSPEELPGPGSASWAGLPAYVELLEQCWSQQPADRPSFVQIVPRLT